MTVAVQHPNTPPSPSTPLTVHTLFYCIYTHTHTLEPPGATPLSHAPCAAFQPPQLQHFCALSTILLYMFTLYNTTFLCIAHYTATPYYNHILCNLHLQPHFFATLPLYSVHNHPIPVHCCSVAEPPLFGRLWLRKSEVPEPNPAPNKLGRLRLQAKKGNSSFMH